MAAVEQKKQYAVVKDFKGVNTKNSRTVIENGEFGWLENAMPIGFGNLRIIEGNEVSQRNGLYRQRDLHGVRQHSE
jgi:hypothetical protein